MGGQRELAPEALAQHRRHEVGAVVLALLAAAGEMLERGETLEDFRARLPELLAAMDDSALVETLHRMGFSAALSGQAGLTDE